MYKQNEYFGVTFLGVFYDTIINTNECHEEVLLKNSHDMTIL